MVYLDQTLIIRMNKTTYVRLSESALKNLGVEVGANLEVHFDDEKNELILRPVNQDKLAS